MFAQRERSASTALWTGALLVYLVATRWPLAPKYLYYFDSANFALALENFNPALHQPQPPGYPLFVALTRIIHLFVLRPERVFLIAGLIAALAAVLLIRVLAREMFGRTAGILAAVLLATNPVFWFGGITNQIRVFLAVSAIGVSLLAWRAVSRPREPHWLYATFGALAIAGGFRPAFPMLMVPLVLWIWWRNGARPRQLAIGVATLAATAFPWLAVTVWAVGGGMRYVQVLEDYAVSQFQGSSALFGAAAPSAFHMFAEAVVWNLLGTLVWIWAVPFLVRSNPYGSARLKAVFLGLALLPSFLFSAFVHIGDPDQALASISILCVIGGAVLAPWSARWGKQGLAATAAGVVVVQSVLFFLPPTRIARAASYRAVAAVDRMTTGAMTSIEALRRQGPLTIVHYGSSVASRQLAYYFPEDYVVVLPASAGESTEMYFEHQPLGSPAAAAGLIRPGARRIVCLLPWNSKGAELPGWKRRGPVYYRDRSSGENVAIGGFTLVSPGNTVATIQNSQ
jgi:4-amino-4-deoxy-L-arabinose transferase-like glycosyltransferase